LNRETISNAADFPPFTVPAQWWPAEQARAAVVLLPAMGTPARYYEPFAEAGNARGLNVLVADLPGTGGSLPRPSGQADYGYSDLVERFLPPLVAAARDRSGRLPLIVAGHSLGAHVGALAALHDRISIDALVTLAGGDIHYRNWSGQGAGKVLFVAWVVAVLSYLPGAVPGQYLGLGGPQARSLMREWSGMIRNGFSVQLAGDARSHSAVPSLCLAYQGDFMAPGSSVTALARTLGGDFMHLPVDWPGNPHASWARHPNETLRVIEDWLAKQSLVAER